MSGGLWWENAEQGATETGRIRIPVQRTGTSSLLDRLWADPDREEEPDGE
ncbi:hypothetical protein KIH74_25435 [Kineosporia sp. J2-2]|uniref:Uncharacterized protein n=1 Tax=Kineosporia corallincola TaxID=2835133 RepID=A0ABS5TN95_9ACTN|nr:hypothetical protein [Kineosporia corallincola]MBT0772313.1 hypothetical protein [Kineosporia corallincola]